MPRGKMPLRESIKGSLRTQIDEIWRRAEGTQEFQKGDNVQGRRHCLAVEHNLGLLIPDEKKEECSQTELFTLSAAACLHDIGKVESSDPLGWKSDHGVRSRDLIIEHYDKLGLDRAQAAAVGYIVGVHGTGKLNQLPLKPLLVGTDEVRLIPLAAVFRLADMLDTSYQRAPEVVARIKFPGGDVPPKWRARQAISGWTLDERNRIVLQAIPEPDELQVAYTLQDMMTEDVAKIAAQLRLSGSPFEVAELDVGNIRLSPALKAESARSKPFPGMAYYEENQAGIFRGRETETERLLSIVSRSPVTLLVGESGAGKTSLVHAGLFPRLKAMLWNCVWTRPLDNPEDSIKQLVWRALCQGQTPQELDLWQVMKVAAEKCQPNHLLVVMDQFEDILSSPQSVLDKFALDLLTVQSGTVIPNLRVLLSFREDSFVKLSTRLLKKVTGSARQFPSVELERLTREGARQAFQAGLELAHIGLDPRQDAGQQPLIDTILDDIQKGDDRLYPPYIQMVAETLCSMVDSGNPMITRELYFETAKGAESIIAHYLLNRIREFGPQAEKAKKLLVRLTSSAGKKTRRTPQELTIATGIAKEEVDEILNRMADLRMARQVGDEYEIIHDYLGKIVDADLVNAEDRTVKFLQEQLDAFQHLYEVHRTPIGSPPLLASLYRNRRSVVVDEGKIPLLLCTHLSWIGRQTDPWSITETTGGRNGGCGWYWLRTIPLETLLDRTFELVRHDIEDVSRAAIDLFGQLAGEQYSRRKLDGLGDPDARVREALMRVMQRFATPEDEDRLIPHLKDSSADVRLATLHALARAPARGTAVAAKPLLKDRDWRVRRAALKVIGEVATREDIDTIFELVSDDDADVREAAAAALAKAVTADDVDRLYTMLVSEEPHTREVSARVIGAMTPTAAVDKLLPLLDDPDEDVRGATADALAKVSTSSDWTHIIEMLDSPKWRVRQASLKALSKCESRDDRARVAPLLKDNDKDVQLAALAALSKNATHEDRQVVLPLLHNSNSDVRDAAVALLERLTTRVDRDEAIAMCDDGNWSIREAGVASLIAIADPGDADRFLPMFSDNSWHVRRAAVRGFCEVARRDQLDLVVKVLSDSDSDVRKEATRTYLKLVTHDDLDRIVSLLRDDSTIVRRTAVRALTSVANVGDADDLLDQLADGVHGWDAKARSHFDALSGLDLKFYSTTRDANPGP